MRHPVYPFRAVLRELRLDAGLTILAAAEATGYGKYERSESGHTKVGGQYLRSIADAFAATDELLSFSMPGRSTSSRRRRTAPRAGSASTSLRRHVRLAPDTVIDLQEHKDLVVESDRHVDLALLCLAAR